MLQDQTIPVDFGQGVDTKTDPKQVVAGKLLRLENAVFTNAKRIAKRNGYNAFGATIAAVGSLSSPQLVHAYNNELLCADQNLLLTYSPSQNAWEPVGNYTSIEAHRSTIDQKTSVSGYVDSAVLGNYALYAWSSVAQQNTFSGQPAVYSKVYSSVVDLQTGAVLGVGSPLNTATTNFINQPRCVVLGGTTLAVVYYKADLTALVLRVVSIAGGVVTYGAELTVSTNLATGSFDVVGTATGAAIFYKSTTGVTLATVNTSGTVTGSVVIADANAFGFPLYLSQNSSSSDFWIYWTDAPTVDGGGEPTSLNVVYAVYSSSLALVLAKTTVSAIPSAPYYVPNIISVTNSATQQTVFWGQYAATGGVYYTDTTKLATVNTSGAVSVSFVVYNGICPYSKPFKQGSKNYAAFVYRSAQLIPHSGGDMKVPHGTNQNPQVQPTYFIVDISSGSLVPPVVARLASGLANNQCVLETIIGYTPQISFVSGSKWLFSCAVETQELNTDAHSGVEDFPGGLAGAFSYSLDFAGANCYKAENSGELAILNGALLQCYDGQLCTEFGFHTFPEIVTLTATSATGGAVGAGTYSYIAIFQWTDAQGNLHQSTPSAAVSVTTGAGNNAVTVVVNVPYLSAKGGVAVAIFRTTNNGSVYYLTSDPVFLKYADPSAGVTVSFTDLFSDTNLQKDQQAYTYPSSPVLENSTPPPSMIMVNRNKRLWFVNSENENEIWYTKAFSKGTGLSPSALLLDEIDPKHGKIIALAEMDDKLVGFKQRGLFVQAGDGANDAGTGSTLSDPQYVPSDVGCSSMKSVIATPSGVLFQSPNGIYRLSRALAVEYIGMEVESYNAQTIVAATLVPGKTQIRFLVSSGLTLVYDYVFGQWSTFTNHTGTAATAWSGSYVYATTGSNVFQEASGVYADNGTKFSMLLQSSWLRIGAVQGFQRVRRLALLGDYANGGSGSHALSVQAAYDFVNTFGTAVSYVFGSSSSSGVMEYRERLQQQKCTAISLLIQETTTGDSAEYVDLASIGFEAAVKKGLNKLSQNNSAA